MKLKKLLILAVIGLTTLLLLCSCFGGGNEECQHKYDENYIIREATCEEDGLREFICYNCYDTKEEVIPALGHHEVVGKGFASTCTSDGLTDNIWCDVCNTTLQYAEPIPAGHVENGIKNIMHPEYNYAGRAYIGCDNCSADVKEIYLPKLSDSAYTVVSNSDETKTFSITKDGYDISFTISNFEVGQVYVSGVGYRAALVAYRGDSTNVVIPETLQFQSESISVIGANAFKGNTNIVSVTLPSTVNRFEAEAFNGCTSLESVISTSSISVSNKMFYGCTSLKNIPAVGSVGEYAFTGCSALESVDIGGDISKYAFSSCTALKNVSINWEYSGYILGERAFYNCSALESLSIPDKISYGQYGDCALEGCTSLKFLSIPYGFGEYFGTVFTDWYISQSAASHNASVPASLTHVEIVCEGSYGNIPKFTNCTGIKSITLTGGMDTIPYGAFDGCSALEALVLPSSIKEIGATAFAGCTSLVTNVYDNGIYIGSGENPYFVLIGLTDEAKGGNIQDFVIKDGTRVVINGFYNSCPLMNSITIPASISGFSEFTRSFTKVYYKGTLADWCKMYFTQGSANPIANCQSFYMLNAEGEFATLDDHLVIPESVTEINPYVFQGYNYTALTLHGGITAIYDRMPVTLEKVYYDGDIVSWMNIVFSGDYYRPTYYADEFYMKGANGQWEILTTIVIPDTVTEIEYGALMYFKGVHTVVIPDSVTKLGYYMFYKCDNLYNVYYEGTAENWSKLVKANNPAFTNTINLFVYSETEQTLEDYFGGAELTWHYNESGKPEAWIKLENNVDGKTYTYSSTEVVVSDSYWQTLQYAEAQGMLEYMLDEILLEMYRTSSTKEEYAEKISEYASKAGQNLSVSFADGKMIISQNGVSASAVDYVECDGKIYVKALNKPAVFYYVDAENGCIYEITTDENSGVIYTTTTHTWVLN